MSAFAGIDFCNNQLYGFVRIKRDRVISFPWKVRWVVLNNTTLSIFRNELESSLWYQFRLNRNIKIEAILDVIDGEKCCFSVSDNSRTVNFAVKDTFALEKWMMAIINNSHGAFRASENFYMGEGGIGDMLKKQQERVSSITNVVSMSGTFEKEGHFLPTWKRRYFLLSTTTLQYYKDTNDTQVEDETDSSRVSTRSTSSTIANSLKRLSLRHGKPRELILKGSIDISANTKCAVLPENFAGRPCVMAIITDYFAVGSTLTTEGNEGATEPGVDEDSGDEDASNVVDVQPKFVHRPSTKRSLRISFPDESTMNDWI